MAQHRPLTPQDRAFLGAFKAALREPHEGPSAMPRKAVWLELRIAESTYSRWLSDEEPDWLPSVLDLRRLVNVTGDPSPLRVLARWAGSGYGLAPLCSGADEGALSSAESHRLLASEARASAELISRTAEALEDDGRMDAREAAETLPSAREQLRVARRVVDQLERLAGPIQ